MLFSTCLCLYGGRGVHHGYGHIALLDVLAVQSVGAGAGGEDLGAALAAEEDHPLVKDTQALHLLGTGAVAVGVEGDAVEKPHIHGIEAAVEDHRLHVDIGVQQLSFAALDVLGTAEQLLTALSGIEPQLLHAVLVERYSVLYILLGGEAKPPPLPLSA